MTKKLLPKKLVPKKLVPKKFSPSEAQEEEAPPDIEKFPTFSPSDIRKLLNRTIHAQRTLSIASDGTLTQNSYPHNGLLLITAFFINLKLSNILSGYMGKSKHIREVVTGSSSAAAECETVFNIRNERGESIVKTLMGYPKEKSGASVCWLCGFTIKQMGYVLESLGDPVWKDEAPNANAANAPECEHIVPAGAAMIYLDIPSRKKGTAEGNYDLYVNYEWSHKYCNATASDDVEGEGVAGKSDKLFFNMLDKKTRNLLSPTVNEYNINLWLSRMSITRIMSILIGRYGLTPDAWINNHGPLMSIRVKRVCNYIQSRRANYPTIFSQGLGSQLGGDALTPASPILADPQETVGSGVMVGDLLNLARNVSFVFNDLVIKSANRVLLDALITSQSMMHLRYGEGGTMLAVINANREALTTQTQKGFSNVNGNGILNGVIPPNLITTLSERSIEVPDVNGQYDISMGIWRSTLNEPQAKTVQQIQIRSLSDDNSDGKPQQPLKPQIKTLKQPLKSLNQPLKLQNKTTLKNGPKWKRTKGGQRTRRRKKNV